MPWQMAPPLMIIAGAFTAIGLLLPGLDKLVYGRQRRVHISQYEFGLDRRDAHHKALAALAAAEVAKATAETPTTQHH